MEVAILGCGYVGVELGRQLHAAGHEVIGVRRSSPGLARIEAAGLSAVQGDVTNRETLDGVPDIDWVVFAASPSARSAEAARNVYVEGVRTSVRAFASRVRPPVRFVYTSSTGVYGDHGGAWVDERTSPTPESRRARILLEGEETLRAEADEADMAWTIARFAGLYGADRYGIDRYLEGPVTAGYRNMLHRDDAAGAIAYVLTSNTAEDDLVVGVDDEPVHKWEFADWVADQCGRDPPPKQTVEERLADEDLPTRREASIRADKRCSNDYLRSLGYSFRYPTYREGYRPAIETYLA